MNRLNTKMFWTITSVCVPEDATLIFYTDTHTQMYLAQTFSHLKNLLSKIETSRGSLFNFEIILTPFMTISHESYQFYE
jgi:hypothetical protein